jgi:hypothetical protein
MTTSPSWPKKLHALQGKSSSCASNWGLLQGHVMTCDTIGNPIPLMLNTPRNHGPQYVEFLHETMVSWDKFTYDIICDHMVYCMRNRRNRPATTGGCYISWCPSCSKCEKMAASRWMIWPLGSSRRISQKLWRFLKVWQFWLCYIYIYIYLVIYFSHCKSHCCFFLRFSLHHFQSWGRLLPWQCCGWGHARGLWSEWCRTKQTGDTGGECPMTCNIYI